MRIIAGSDFIDSKFNYLHTIGIDINGDLVGYGVSTDITTRLEYNKNRTQTIVCL